ncbi:MAG: hypothetical protein MZU97_10185 [Bacillus subtilis]|nr:hypothetical protein [Bacillus subtilis]
MTFRTSPAVRIAPERKIRRQQHPDSRRTRSRQEAPRHVHRQHRTARLASPGLGDRRQRRSTKRWPASAD